MNSNKLEKRIEILAKESEDIENLAIELIKSAPTKYYPNLDQYGFGSLPENLVKIQQEVIIKYNSWYNSVYSLIEKYLPHQLDEFKKRYKRGVGGWFSYDITRILELKVDIYKGDKLSVVEEFRDCFTFQKSQLLSLKNIDIEETSKQLSSLNQLEQSLVQPKNIIEILPSGLIMEDEYKLDIFKDTYKTIKGFIFVLMPFQDQLNQVYVDYIKKPLERKGYSVKRADDFFNPQPIMKDIWKSINEAEIIIADLTGKNPNVFYELGLAHELGKYTILITQNLNDVPFDLKPIRIIEYKYEPAGFKKLRHDIKDFIDSKNS